MPPRCFELISHYDRRSENHEEGSKNERLATLERGMAGRDLQNHRSFTFSVVYTCLAAEMGMGHLGCLEAHQTEVLSDATRVGSTVVNMQKY
jgi:hypothetical protein